MDRPVFSIRLLAMLMAAVLAAPQLLPAAAEPIWPAPGSVPGITKRQQEAIGLKMLGEVYRQVPVVPDSSPLVQYVQQLGHKLQLAIPHQYSWPFQFHVIPQKEVNAFVLPGGPVFITAGAILAAGDEAELAGLLAHAMGHVYRQHGVTQRQKDSLPSVVDDASAMLGSMLAGIAPHAIGPAAAVSIFTRYSATEELQADAVAAVILYKAGYDPQALAAFFQRMEQNPAASPQFTGDHPSPGNRGAMIRGKSQGWPEKTWLGDSPQFLTARDQAKGMKLYTAQEIEQNASQGVWAQENAKLAPAPAIVPVAGTPATATGEIHSQKVRASATFSRLARPGYHISYPANWQALGDRQSPSATIVPPGAFNQSAIAYGVVINRFSPADAKATLEQATNELIHSITGQSPGMTAETPREITADNLHGRSVDLMGDSPVQRDGKPEAEHDWLVALPQSGGGILYLVFISPAPDFERLRPTFERMLKSFHMQ
jgi:hypothetical protein